MLLFRYKITILFFCLYALRTEAQSALELCREQSVNGVEFGSHISDGDSSLSQDSTQLRTVNLLINSGYRVTAQLSSKLKRII